MRPHGAVVIRHRIVSRLSRGNSANSPTRKTFLTHESVCKSLGSLRLHNPCEQTLSRVRTFYATGFFIAIESYCIGAKIFQPKSPIEFFTKFVSELVVPMSEIMFVQMHRHFSGF